MEGQRMMAVNMEERKMEGGIWKTGAIQAEWLVCDLARADSKGPLVHNQSETGFRICLLEQAGTHKLKLIVWARLFLQRSNKVCGI